MNRSPHESPSNLSKIAKLKQENKKLREANKKMREKLDALKKTK